MKLHNIMEALVADSLESLLSRIDNVCKCEKCRLDIMALTLNKLQPKYVACNRGETFAKTVSLDFQFHADVTKELTKALEIVRKRPLHDK